MIITRSPLRITLGGGGTDLPSYYQEHEGFLIAAAINKYVYIALHQTFVPELIVKYSEIERVKNVSDLKHPIIREALLLTETETSFLEIASMADIHAGTGLGSSGSFTTALLKALHLQRHEVISLHALAEEACHIEIDLLGEPIGKQDQYIASFGGLTCFKFLRNGEVDVSPLKITRQTLEDLEENLVLFFTGQSRSASQVLDDQNRRTKAVDKSMLDNLHYTKELGLRSQEALESANFVLFAELMNEHWKRKRERSNGMSNECINKWYELALRNGALGGKLIGAGGGGFLMFYTESKRKLRQAMQGAGLSEVRFKFDFEGTKAVIA